MSARSTYISLLMRRRRKLTPYERVLRGNTIDAIVTFMWYALGILAILSFTIYKISF